MRLVCFGRSQSYHHPNLTNQHEKLITMPATTSEIIASAVYLEDKYNPCVLTVSHLCGILHHHGINYTSDSKKSQLSSLFEKHITQNRAQLLRDRNTLNICEASNTGITDGVTGELISERDVSDRRMHIMAC